MYLTKSTKFHLVSPLVYNRHVDVVDEDGHFLSSRRTVRASHALFQVAFDGSLR